jgi:ribulose-phosphate 3-epimerase
LLPTTNIDVLEYVLDKIDLILVMCVNPGFGGQEFMPSQLPKIYKIAKLIQGSDILLSVDGGINADTSKLCKDQGANMLVSGSYIFGGDYRERIELLRG